MGSTLTTILVALISALLGTGGGITGYAKLRELRDRRDESEIGRLRADVAGLTEREHTCEAQLDEVRQRLLAVEHHHGSYLARWIKDADRRLTWINDKAFLSIFAPLGLDRASVLKKTFAELLDASAAAEIERLDQAALAHPDVAASNLIQLHPSLPVMVIVKVAAIGREGGLVYEGYAYRTNDRMIADGQGAVRQMEALRVSADNLILQEAGA